MKRNLLAMANTLYDVLVVGGGIYGACVAWDAALRGLQVGLIEKSDFGSGTSANSLKIIHGGLRCLQRGNLMQMREYVSERSAWMRTAPHLIHPLPVIIPTYHGCGWPKRLLSAALLLNDAIGFDRNRIRNPEKFIPCGKVISRSECLQRIPGVSQENLTGGIVFYDAQVSNTERLLLSIIKAADKVGATLVNYVEATRLLASGSMLHGVEAKDVLTGDRFQIRARFVINACGPWLGAISGFPNGSRRAGYYAAAINLVTRPLSEKYAFGISGANGFEDRVSLIPKNKPLLFVTPWRGHSIIGTRYRRYQGAPDQFGVTEKDIRDFLKDIREAWPSAALEFGDVTFVHAGLLPCVPRASGTETVTLLNKHRIIDHRDDGLSGVLSVVGVKYTMARAVAEKVVNRLLKDLKRKKPRSRTSMTPIYGGDMEQVESFVRAELKDKTCSLNEKSIRRLISTYGSRYSEVLQYLDAGEARELGEDLAVLKAQVLHAVRDEMAQKLSDVVFRRTDLGSAGRPGNEALQLSLETMAAELNWGPEKFRRELDETSCALQIGSNNQIAA